MPLSEKYQLSKVEGQIWISLYELLLNPHCSSKYEYTEYKKNQVLKVYTYKTWYRIKLFHSNNYLTGFLVEKSLKRGTHRSNSEFGVFTAVSRTTRSLTATRLQSRAHNRTGAWDLRRSGAEIQRKVERDRRDSGENSPRSGR